MKDYYALRISITQILKQKTLKNQAFDRKTVVQTPTLKKNFNNVLITKSKVVYIDSDGIHIDDRF
jgi:hypothetical protein